LDLGDLSDGYEVGPFPYKVLTSVARRGWQVPESPFPVSSIGSLARLFTRGWDNGGAYAGKNSERCEKSYMARSRPNSRRSLLPTPTPGTSVLLRVGSS